MLTAIGESLREKAGALGYDRVEDLVGHGEHLVQVRGQDRLDVTELMQPLPAGRTIFRRERDRSMGADDGNAGDDRSALGRDGGAQDPIDLCRVSSHETPSGYDSVRMVGTALAGALVRAETHSAPARDSVDLAGLVARAGEDGVAGAAAQTVRVEARGVLGQGLAVFHTRHLDTVTLGGGQDGVAKGSIGGRVAVLKAKSADGIWRDGSVGKSFAYGAQGGRLFVQGDADTRACVRFSGGQVVFGGFPHGRVDGAAARANLKGFAFEYMTGGVAVCLGDPGPWLGAGMTGGRIYVRLWPDLGLSLDALLGRLAKGSALTVDVNLSDEDRARIEDALGEYADLLQASGQADEAERVRAEVPVLPGAFARIQPRSAQVAQDISTE
jgi:glutamate synthase (NADPH/NADH) large chain